MRVYVTYKIGSEETQFHTRHYDMAQADFDQFRRDYLAYLNEGASALKGASYRYLDVDTNQMRELVVRFDDILYIESVLQEVAAAGVDAAATTITSPLQARLANTGGAEGTAS